MPTTDRHPSRRLVLTGAAGWIGLASLAGCRDKADTSPQPGQDPLEPMLAASVYLADRYQAAATALPELAAQLTPIREAHQTHVTALSREVGVAEEPGRPAGRPPVEPSGAGEAAATTGSASQAPLPTDRAAMLADLRELERIGHRQAAACCIAAPGYRAELVGSIAAARASHLEVLT